MAEVGIAYSLPKALRMLVEQLEKNPPAPVASLDRIHPVIDDEPVPQEDRGPDIEDSVT